MPLTLAQYRARIAQALVDVSNNNYATGALDEALKKARDEYSMFAPLDAESLITLPGDGRTIALNELSGLLAVTQIWWPYNSLLDDDDNEAANLVKGVKLRFDDAQPIVQLKTTGNAQPQTDDEAYVWWTKPHTIQDLDSASVTTFPAPHESAIVLAAAGYAAIGRAADRIDEFNLDQRNPGNLLTWGNTQLAQWRAWLAAIRAGRPAGGTETFGAGWARDDWDSQQSTF